MNDQGNLFFWENEMKNSSVTGPHQFYMEAWIACAPFERLLKMEIVSALEGQAVLRMPFCIDLAQGAGLMHGGALVSLADTAVVMAIKSLVPPQTHFATISMETKFLYPVKQGIVMAKARVTGHEDRILRGEATVYDENGKAVLSFSSVFKMGREKKIRDITFEDRE
jgi:uncharacterized protein (TIGR00369 family)